MTRLIILVTMLLALPAALFGTTGSDLRSRIIIDGGTSDWEDDEWVLDASTVFPEMTGDSRWGRDNDIRRVAVTWDDYNLYVAVEAVTVSTTLMLFLDTMCGGVEDLTHQEYFIRNVEFGGFSPNFMVRVDRNAAEALAGYLDCTRPLNLIENNDYQSVYRQEGVRDGAFEAAIPWELVGGFERSATGVTVPETGVVLGVLGAVTGGPATGAGDAAPDPSVVLESDSTRIAVLDNEIQIALDSNGDGLVDIGVSPRAVAVYALPHGALDNPVRQVLPIKVPLDRKLYSPDGGGVVEFPVTLDPPDYELPVFVTARIYSAAGKLVRTLVEDQPMVLSKGGAGIEWDWKDDGGNIVPGGIYVIAVSGGAGKGTSKNTARASFAIVR